MWPFLQSKFLSFYFYFLFLFLLVVIRGIKSRTLFMLSEHFTATPLEHFSENSQFLRLVFLWACCLHKFIIIHSYWLCLYCFFRHWNKCVNVVHHHVPLRLAFFRRRMTFVAHLIGNLFLALSYRPPRVPLLLTSLMPFVISISQKCLVLPSQKWLKYSLFDQNVPTSLFHSS